MDDVKRLSSVVQKMDRVEVKSALRGLDETYPSKMSTPELRKQLERRMTFLIAQGGVSLDKRVGHATGSMRWAITVPGIAYVLMFSISALLRTLLLEMGRVYQPQCGRYHGPCGRSPGPSFQGGMVVVADWWHV